MTTITLDVPATTISLEVPDEFAGEYKITPESPRSRRQKLV